MKKLKTIKVRNAYWHPFNPDIFFVVGDSFSKMYVYNYKQTKQPIAKYDDEMIASAHWHPNGNLIVMALQSGKIVLYDYTNSKVIKRYEGKKLKGIPFQSLLSSNGNYFVVFCEVGWVWSLIENRLVLTNEYGLTSVRKSYWGNDNQTLVLEFFNNKVEIWDCAKGQLIHNFSVFPFRDKSLFEVKNNLLVFVDEHEKMLLFDLITGEVNLLATINFEETQRLFWNHTGEKILQLTDTEFHNVWDIRTKTVEQVISLPHVKRVQWHPSENIIAFIHGERFQYADSHIREMILYNTDTKEFYKKTVIDSLTTLTHAWNCDGTVLLVQDDQRALIAIENP
jgi:WD40 repeat protein